MLVLADPYDLLAEVYAVQQSQKCFLHSSDYSQIVGYNTSTVQAPTKYETAVNLKLTGMMQYESGILGKWLAMLKDVCAGDRLV